MPPVKFGPHRFQEFATELLQDDAAEPSQDPEDVRAALCLRRFVSELCAAVPGLHGKSIQIEYQYIASIVPQMCS